MFIKCWNYFISSYLIVIPVQTGIQNANHKMDSHFRGNDNSGTQTLGELPIENLNKL